jgi:hypothetical protein
VAVPPPVATQLGALARADVGAIVGAFENGGVLRDAGGHSYEKTEGGGALREYYERLFAVDGTKGGGIEMLKGARADDGSLCALEYTVVRVLGKTVAPQAGLAVYERGASGLLRGVRVYEDIDLTAPAPRPASIEPKS